MYLIKVLTCVCYFGVLVLTLVLFSVIYIYSVLFVGSLTRIVDPAVGSLSFHLLSFPLLSNRVSVSRFLEP